MSNVSDFLGGGGGLCQPTRVSVIFSSTVYTVRTKGKVRITGIGPGGSGAASTSSSKISGGGAGAYGESIITASPGDTIVVEIGAFGAGLISNDATFTSNGNSGGVTSVTHKGVTRTLGGGEGGKTSGAPALGGVATGWDLNFNGGNSGAVTTGNGSSGGGAVNVFGAPVAEVFSGEIVTGTGATGGASPGGKSGDVLANLAVTGGAGVGGQSPNNSVASTAGAAGVGIVYPDFVVARSSTLDITGAGGASAYQTSSLATSPDVSATAGSASGAALTSSSAGTSTGKSGAFAGSGGTYGAAQQARTGDAGYGAGSGGARRGGISGATSTGNGGASLVIIEEF